MSDTLEQQTSMIPVWFLTDADDIHEAVHAVAYLEKQVLALPASRRAEGGPDQPGDASHQEQGTQYGCCYLHFFYHSQGDGLPLQEDTTHFKALFFFTGLWLPWKNKQTNEITK